jgi:hypothetical protein
VPRLSNAVVLGLLIASPGCTHANLVPADEVRRLVLQPADVPETLARFDEGPESMGRIGGQRAGSRGWAARYRQVDPESRDGPLVVQSLARVYEGEEQAASALASHLRRLRSQGSSVFPEAPTLGDEAWAASLEQPTFSGRVLYFTVAWRHRNVIAVLTVQGFEGKVAFEDAAALARKQQDRIAHRDD